MRCGQLVRLMQNGQRAALSRNIYITWNAQRERALANEADDDFHWLSFDENTAAGMCYTSGTTGNPKGVVYSHRSNVLHAMSVMMPDSLCLSARDTVMPVVPLFHANSW